MKRNVKKRNGRGRTSSAKCETKKIEDREEYSDSVGNDRDPSGKNDVAWYAQTPELLRDAASFPFSNAVGAPFYLDWAGDGISVNDSPRTVPGIMTYDIIPCPGYGESANSPLNTAAFSIYSFVRHANSGSANYDAPDLMLYLIALANVYSYINYLQRIYGTLNMYSHFNRYMPRGIVQAQHAQFDNIIEHIADFRYGINALIYKASSFACPADMPYFSRLAFLFSNVYAEGESAKDQLYMYTPRGFMQYSETTSQDGGQLTFKPLITSAASPLTYGQLLQYGNQLLSPLIMSEDMNIMSGDILKAYGANGILKLVTLPEVYNITPVTDLTVLEQMKNAKYMDLYSGATITQDSTHSFLKTRVWRTYSPTVEAKTNKNVLTTILTDPTPGDVIERTRLMFTVSTESTGDSTILLCHGASEVVFQCYFWKYDPGAQTFNYQQVQQVMDYIQLSEDTILAAISNFKFHPMIYITVPDTHALSEVIFDFDNYTIIDWDEVHRMNEAAQLSLFRVPNIAKFN